ncbi:MAG: DUF2867 domain-containing protein [Pseudomonadota bacterium]
MTDPHAPDRAPDWSDRHTGPVRPDLTTARAAYEAAFRAGPRWIGWALSARNAVVRVFGLHTTPAGEGMLTLPIIEERPDRYAVGLADRHLTFTLEAALTGGEAALTTRIWFNHWLGRLYLAIVLIPHKIIVTQLLRRVA